MREKARVLTVTGDNHQDAHQPSYLRGSAAHTTHQSRPPPPFRPGIVVSSCTISGNGRYVAFTADAPLVADDTNGAFDAYHLYSFDEAVGRRGWLRRVRIVGIAGTSSAVPLATTIHAWISDLLTQAGVGGLLAASVRFLDTHVNAPGNQELRTNSTFLADLRNRETPPLPVSIPIHTWGGTLD